LHHITAALGFAYVLVGRAGEGLPLLESETPWRMGRAIQLAWLAEAYLLAGRLEEAARRAEMALALAREHHERGHEAWTLRLHGEISLARGHPGMDAAEGAYRQAMDLAQRLEMRPLLAHCHLGLGRLLHRLGRAAAARRELEGSLTLFRSMAMEIWASRAASELAASAPGPGGS
jgi:tetratricopeptide (TPR) repeat protein